MTACPGMPSDNKIGGDCSSKCVNRDGMTRPDFKKTQRALHLELVEVARTKENEGLVITAEQSPLSAALDYIDAFDVKVAVNPEPGGGIRNVDQLKDKGLALAHALLGVSAELQDEPALRLIAMYHQRVKEMLQAIDKLSELTRKLSETLPLHGLWWTRGELAFNELTTHLSLMRAALTARCSLLEALTRETWHEDEDVRLKELLGTITELLSDAFKPSEIAKLVDDGSPPDPPTFQRVRKRLKARGQNRPRRNWEGWFIGRGPDGRYIRLPAGTFERAPSKAKE